MKNEGLFSRLNNLIAETEEQRLVRDGGKFLGELYVTWKDPFHQAILNQVLAYRVQQEFEPEVHPELPTFVRIENVFNDETLLLHPTVVVYFADKTPPRGAGTYLAEPYEPDELPLTPEDKEKIMNMTNLPIIIGSRDIELQTLHIAFATPG